MACNKKCESFIFKRFDSLAARNLLYLQSELARLEAQLSEYDEADYKARGDLGWDARQCARSWNTFKRTHENSIEQRKRWELHEDIRITLREYR